MINVSDKRGKGNENTHLMFGNLLFYEIMWKNAVEPERPQMSI